MEEKDLELLKDSVNERLKEAKESFDYIMSCFNMDAKKAELSELKQKQESADFWLDQENAKHVSKRISQLEGKIKEMGEVDSKMKDIALMLELSNEDASLIVEADAEIKAVGEQIDKMKLQSLLNGKYDNNPAIVTIHAGAGGTEAQDWASMLLRMYQMYAEKNGFEMKVLDMLDGDVAGIKSVTFSLDGDYAYGYMKAEKGVHRLVRISPFDSGARRHTSFASVEVMPEIDDEIAEIEVRPDEIRVDTYRASGAGGQHINKTDSAVRITHFATGIVVTCQNERSQIQNREMAMKILKSKLLTLKEEEEQAKLNEIKGEIKKIEWGSQIRSYVFCPYTLVKDHRTNFETANINAVMDGDIQPFIEDYLKKTSSKQ